MAGRAAFVSRSREAGQTAADIRRAWVVFLSVARSNARLAIAGRWPTPEDTFAFAGLIVRLKAPFPVNRLAAQEVAGAALKISRALAGAAMPEDRDELGELLLAALGFLDRVLADDLRGRAELSRRIAGDGDED